MLKAVFKKIVKLLVLLVFKFLDLFQIKKGNILLQTVDPNLFTDNTKYLYLYLSKKKNLNVFWVTNSLSVSKLLKKHKLNYINPKINIIRFFYQLYKTKILIDSGTKYFNPLGLTDSLKIIKITTMHGIGLKTVPDPKTLKMESDDFNKFDYVGFTSQYTKKTIGEKLFKIRAEKLLILGYPRCDQYFNKKKNIIKKKKKNLVKRYFSFNRNKIPKVILYTPTWRPYNYALPILKLKDFTFKKFNLFLEKNNLLFFFIDHYLENKNYSQNYERIIKIDRFSNPTFDTSEFILETDILLNDYATTSTECSILNLPQIFFMPDYDKYLRKSFVENYKKNLLGPEVKSFEELKKKILEYSLNKNSYNVNYKEKLKSYKKKYYDFRPIDKSSEKYYYFIKKFF